MGLVRGTNNSRDLDPLLSVAVPSGPTTDTCREIRFMSLALPRSLPKVQVCTCTSRILISFWECTGFHLIVTLLFGCFHKYWKCSIQSNLCTVWPEFIGQNPTTLWLFRKLRQYKEPARHQHIVTGVGRDKFESTVAYRQSVPCYCPSLDSVDDRDTMKTKILRTDAGWRFQRDTGM